MGCDISLMVSVPSIVIVPPVSGFGEEVQEEAPMQEESVLAAPPAELPEIKLFGRWSCDDVTVSDMSLADYIAVKEKNARDLPHSAGRFAAELLAAVDPAEVVLPGACAPGEHPAGPVRHTIELPRLPQPPVPPPGRWARVRARLRPWPTRRRSQNRRCP